MGSLFGGDPVHSISGIFYMSTVGLKFWTVEIIKDVDHSSCQLGQTFFFFPFHFQSYLRFNLVNGLGFGLVLDAIQVS